MNRELVNSDDVSAGVSESAITLLRMLLWVIWNKKVQYPDLSLDKKCVAEREDKC